MGEPSGQYTEALPHGCGIVEPSGAKKPAAVRLGSVVPGCGHVWPAGHSPLQSALLWSIGSEEAAWKPAGQRVGSG